MGKLTDIQIRAWVRNGERFEGRSDGMGLYLSFPATAASPVWKFRYRFAGKQRIMNMGSFASLPLDKARETARDLSAKVALGHDVAGEKQERKRNAIEKIDAEKAAWTVSQLCDQFFERIILPKWKHADIVRRRIENDIKPKLGKMKAENVKPRDIDDML